MLASKVAVLKCHHGIAVKCFRYQDTRPTDPSLVRSLILAVSIAIFQTCFSCYKDKWIAATDIYIYIYIPRRKSGIYWIQVRRAAAAAAAAAAVEISLWTR